MPNKSLPTLGTILSQLALKLSDAGIEASWREARLLAAYVLKKPYTWVFAHPESTVSPEDEHSLHELTARRCAHEPLAKITQHKEFWGLSFKTTRDTLDPRPDSETLIEKMVEDHPDRLKPYRILDLGTGTGCLLLSALSEFPHATGIGVDQSDAALAVARENAQILGLDDRSAFLKSNWGEVLAEKFDIILTNPPYIAESEPLPAEVRLFDPPQALFSKNSGLADYEAIAKGLKNILSLTGLAYVELGINQSNSVVQIFEKYGYFCVSIKNDLHNIERCAIFAYQACK